MVAAAHSRLDKLKICGDCQGLGSVKLCDSGKGALHIVRDTTCSRCAGEGMIYVGKESEREAFYAERRKPRESPKPKGMEGLLAAVTLKEEADGLAKSGSHAEAEAKYDEAIRLDGVYLAPVANRAHARLARGDVDGCVVDCTRVIREAPEKSRIRCRALLRRAVASMTRANARDCERAIDDCQTLLMDQPKHPKGEATLAEARAGLKAHLAKERADLHGKVDFETLIKGDGATDFENLD